MNGWIRVLIVGKKEKKRNRMDEVNKPLQIYEKRERKIEWQNCVISDHPGYEE